jgi:hypothetical protein
LTFAAADSGQNGHQVIWRAASGATPVFSGAAAVTGWTDTGRSVNGNEIWAAPAPSGISAARELYVNNQPAILARSDNYPSYSVLADANGNRVGYSTASNTISTWHNIQDVEFVYHTQFVTSECPAASASADGVNDVVVMAEPCWDRTRTYIDQPVYVQNAYELMNQPGEWYFDKEGTVSGSPQFYYIPRAGQSMVGSQAVSVTVPGVQQLLSVSGTGASQVHNLTFSGFTFADSTWRLPTQSNLVDDATPSISYSSTNGVSDWTAQTGFDGQYDGTQHFAADPTASFSYSFGGTGISLISAQDPTRGQFTYSIDGGTAKTASCFSATTVNGKACVTVSGLVNGTHTLTVTNLARSSGGGTYLSLDALNLLPPTAGSTIDDANPAIAYSSTSGVSDWTLQTGVGGQYEGTQHYTTHPAASFNYSFTGTGIVLISAQDSTRGKFTYSIDGQPAQTATCYSATAVNGAACATVSGLSNATHTLTVTNLPPASGGGTYLSLDALQLPAPPPVTPFQMIDDTTSAISYSSTGGVSDWTLQSAGGQYEGTQHFTTSPTASFSYPFSGTNIALISDQNTNRGKFSYSIDGGAVQTATCLSPSAVDGAACLTIGGLSNGAHTLTVTNLPPASGGGAYLSVDALLTVAPGELSTGYSELQAGMIMTDSTQGCDIADYVPTPSAVEIAYANHITFENDTITRVGDGGLGVEKSSHDITLTGNNIFDVAANAITIGGVSEQDARGTGGAVQNIMVNDNYVHDIALEFRGDVGIVAGFVNSATITHNEIADVPYTGISLGWGWGFMDAGGGPDATYCPSQAQQALDAAGVSIAGNNTITDNYVHDYARAGEDAGGIYALGYQTKAAGSSNPYASLLDGNYVANSSDNYRVRGLYLDNGSQHWQASNNIDYHVQEAALLNYASGEIASKNNTDINNVTDPTQNTSVAQAAGLETSAADSFGAVHDWATELHGAQSTTNLAQSANVTATASEVWHNDSTYDGAQAIDGNGLTRWTTDRGATPANNITLTVSFPSATSINRTRLLEDQNVDGSTGNQTGSINHYTIQYLDAGGTWQTAYTNSYPTPVQTDTFPSITTSELRLVITSSWSGNLAVSEFGIYDDTSG